MSFEITNKIDGRSTRSSVTVHNPQQTEARGFPQEEGSSGEPFVVISTDDWHSTDDGFRVSSDLRIFLTPSEARALLDSLSEAVRAVEPSKVDTCENHLL